MQDVEYEVRRIIKTGSGSLLVNIPLKYRKFFEDAVAVVVQELNLGDISGVVILPISAKRIEKYAQKLLESDSDGEKEGE